MNDYIPQTEIPPPARDISISARAVRVIAFSLVLLLAIAGTTLGTITLVQLTHTRNQLTQTQQSLTQAKDQLSTAQSQLRCMSPTIDYLSQFNGWFQQNSTDANGNVTGTWYLPGSNSGQPTASGDMSSCDG
jgi:xanthine/uracil/vitamin C permease (AzgA family)